MRAVTLAWFAGLVFFTAVGMPRFVAFPVLLAGIVVSTTPLLLSDWFGAWLTKRWSLPSRLFWPLAVLTTGFGPAWGAWFCARNPDLRVGLLLSLTMLVGGLVASWLVRRYAPERLHVPFFLSVIQISAYFGEAHIVENTLESVREGTELLRLGVFYGTWAAGVGLALGWMFRVGDAVGVEIEAGRKRIAAWILRLGTVAVGLVLLWADRNVYEGLYPGLHTWMMFVGLGSLSVGLVSIFERLTRVTERHWPFVVGVSVAALASVAFLFFSPLAADPFVRASISDAHASGLALRLREAAPVGQGLEQADHPELDYDRFLDFEHDLPRYNVVLLSVDTLRSDWVGPGVPQAGNTPRLDQIIAEASWFPRGYSPGNRTAVSMSALHLGRYSANIEWQLFIWSAGKVFDPAKLTEQQRKRLHKDWGYTTVPVFPPKGTISQRMQKAGYYTLGTPYVRNDAFFKKGLGFERGYDSYDTDFPGGPASRVVKQAFEQLDARPKDGKPFFHWIHLFDPHDGKAKPDTYGPMIKRMDDGVGELVDGLKERGLWDETIFVLVSDHGEAFGEHGFRYHGHSLFEEQIRVPVIVRVPGQKARTTDLPVSVVDVIPTILSATGGDLAETDGVNLLPYVMEGTIQKDRPVFAEMHRYRGNSGNANRDAKTVIVGWDKLIHNRKKSWVKLFDLEEDPGELDNLTDERPERTRELLGILLSWVNPRERANPLPNIEPPPPPP